MELVPKKKNFLAFLKMYRVIFAYFCLVILRENFWQAQMSKNARLSKFHQLNTLIRAAAARVQQCYAGAAHH